jgi:hypothetical protein
MNVYDIGSDSPQQQTKLRFLPARSSIVEPKPELANVGRVASEAAYGDHAHIETAVGEVTRPSFDVYVIGPTEVADPYGPVCYRKSPLAVACFGAFRPILHRQAGLATRLR